MNETPEVRCVGEGKYSFVVGRNRYTLISKLREDDFLRVVSTVQRLVSSFPAGMSQEERLFLSLMVAAYTLDDTQLRLAGLLDEVHL